MDRAGAECTRRGGVALRVPHAASTLYLIRLHRALLGRADSRSMRGSTRIRSAATLLRRSAAAPSACRSLRAVTPGQPLSSYSWAPQCAIGAAERDEIERAARQTLRVLQKEPDIFSQAAVEDPVEADVLAAVQAEAASALAAELRSVAAPAGAGDGRLYPAARGDLQLRIRNTFAVLEHGLIERGLEARLLVLAALCGEHLLLLGPPGTAKSALSRQLSKALDAPYFERQLTRFSVPEELFGPLSLTELQKDRYLRKTEGYLPEASIAFVDEIFKANSAILNSLLTIINEREFDNGNRREPVPLICLVGASNEPPDDDELDALFDRFLLRRWVRPVSREGRKALLSLKQTTAAVDKIDGESSSLSIALFTESDVKELKKTAVTTVTIPDDVKQLIEDLLLFLDESGIYVSDRRLVKAAAMLRVAALTSGRTAVSKFDCLLLQHVFWKNPEEAERIQEWFVDYLREPGAEVDQVQFLLGGFCKRMWRTAAENNFSTTDDPNVADQRQATIEKWQLGDLLPLKRILVGKLSDWEKEVVDDEAILSAHIWQTSEDMTRLTQRLRPNLESRRAQVRTVLQEILALEVALKSDSACTKPHLLAAAVPRQGHAIACDLLQPTASTSDQRNGLQLVKALGLGYLLPAGLV